MSFYRKRGISVNLKFVVGCEKRINPFDGAAQKIMANSIARIHFREGTRRLHEMKIAKRILMGLCGVLVVVGLALTTWDAIYFSKYGVGFNDAAFFLGNGEFADWPTGERPAYAYFPLAAYGIAAWFLAVVSFSLWPEFHPFPGRVLRGTE